MNKHDPIEPAQVEQEEIDQQLSIIDDYFAQQSPLAQMVEIKGAFIRLLRLYDELNLQLIKMNRRTANTNARLTVLEGRLRELREEFDYSGE